MYIHIDDSVSHIYHERDDSNQVLYEIYVYIYIYAYTYLYTYIDIRMIIKVNTIIQT
jgi:hypothetical protein